MSDNSESMLDRMARALEAATRQRYVELIDAVEWLPIPFRALVRQVSKESDRSAAILFFSNIEDILSANLKCALREDAQDLLQYPGGLADFSTKLKLIYGLRWIEKRVYNNLRILMKIRNLFAHRIDIHSFNHETIVGLISSMEFAAKDLLLQSVAEEAGVSPRVQYLVCAILSFEGLWRGLMAGPIMCQPEYPPATLVGKNGLPPKNYMRSIYASSALVWEVVVEAGLSLKDSDDETITILSLSDDDWGRAINAKCEKVDWNKPL